MSVGRILGRISGTSFTAGFAHALNGFFEGLGSAGATLTVALYVYAKENGEFGIAFANCRYPDDFDHVHQSVGGTGEQIFPKKENCMNNVNDKKSCHGGKDLCLWYGSTQALKDINIEIEERSITALIGPSGCGKSTFLKSLNRMNDLITGVRITGEVCYRGYNIF